MLPSVNLPPELAGRQLKARHDLRAFEESRAGDQRTLLVTQIVASRDDDDGDYGERGNRLESLYHRKATSSRQTDAPREEKLTNSIFVARAGKEGLDFLFCRSAFAERSRPQEILGLATARGRHEEQGMRVGKDGSRFPANVVFTALGDPAGNLRGFSEFSRDLSKSK